MLEMGYDTKTVVLRVLSVNKVFLGLPYWVALSLVLFLDAYAGSKSLQTPFETIVHQDLGIVL